MRDSESNVLYFGVQRESFWCSFWHVAFDGLSTFHYLACLFVVNKPAAHVLVLHQ